jgi:geranylgeranyl diphosphate synthase type II
MMKNFLSKTAEAVDEWIAQNIKTDNPYCKGYYEAMRYSLLSGGKRLRPALLLASYSLYNFTASNLTRHPAMPYAVALEMAHTYSLIHDDLPQMDNDDFRRGKPSNHKVFGEANAILAGDGLLTLAAHTFASARDTIPPNRKLTALTLFLEALGPFGMAGGQYLDINYSAASSLPPEELKTLVETVHTQKTALFIAASVSCGAVLAGGGVEETDLLSRYGKNIGLAFQIIDDILDEQGEPARTGKSAGKDAKNGKLTYPAVFGIEKSRSVAAGLIEEAKGYLGRIKKDTAILADIADYIYDRNG